MKQTQRRIVMWVIHLSNARVCIDLSTYHTNMWSIIIYLLICHIILFFILFMWEIFFSCAFRFLVSLSGALTKYSSITYFWMGKYRYPLPSARHISHSARYLLQPRPHPVPRGICSIHFSRMSFEDSLFQGISIWCMCRERNKKWLEL